MNEGRRYFIDVALKDITIPIKIGIKEKSEGESTLANVTVQAKIDKKMVGKFEKQVLEIINNRKGYKGPKQLSSSLVKYIDTLNAKSININLRYPFFYEKFLKGVQNKVLIKSMCEYSLRKSALINYKQKYKVEVPIIAEQYIVPGIQRDIIDIPARIIVEVEGFETFFIEDLIETVDKNLNKREYYTMQDSIKDILTTQNTGLALIESIENDLYKNNDIEWCSVKLINRRVPYTYSIKVSGEDRVIVYERKYAEAHLFI